MATEIKSSSVKVKPGQKKEDLATSKGKGVASSTVVKKKVESVSGRQVADPKSKSDATVVKTEIKQKTTTTSSSKTTTKTNTVSKVREKKVYTLPGQKFDVPEEREPLRIFYESLSEQIPSSEMAEFWLMEHGLLSPERAKRAFERKQKKQKQLRMGTPIKSPVERARRVERPESSQKAPSSKNGEAKPRKRALNYSDDDDDFIITLKKGKG